MNWKLIFSLSLFGLFMAIGTSFFISITAEPFCWLVIALICAYIIAKRAPGKYFWHGFMVSIFNGVWMIAAHFIFFDAYIKLHPDMLLEDPAMNMSDQRALMIFMGPVFGIGSGLVQGLLSFLASRLMKRPVAAA